MDEFVFVAPELGALAGVLLGPESGSWYCDEVNVASSRAHRSQRFVCRDTLGGRGAQPAAWLTPVPAEAVVYGSGEAAVILSKVYDVLCASSPMVAYTTCMKSPFTLIESMRRIQYLYVCLWSPSVLSMHAMLWL